MHRHPLPASNLRPRAEPMRQGLAWCHPMTAVACRVGPSTADKSSTASRNTSPASSSQRPSRAAAGRPCQCRTGHATGQMRSYASARVRQAGPASRRGNTLAPGNQTCDPIALDQGGMQPRFCAVQQRFPPRGHVALTPQRHQIFLPPSELDNWRGFDRSLFAALWSWRDKLSPLCRRGMCALRRFDSSRYSSHYPRAKRHLAQGPQNPALLAVYNSDDKHPGVCSCKQPAGRHGSVLGKLGRSTARVGGVEARGDNAGVQHNGKGASTRAAATIRSCG